MQLKAVAGLPPRRLDFIPDLFEMEQDFDSKDKKLNQTGQMASTISDINDKYIPEIHTQTKQISKLSTAFYIHAEKQKNRCKTD